MSYVLCLGAFDVALEAGTEAYRGLLEDLFRGRAAEMPADSPIDLRLMITTTGDRRAFGKSDALESRENGKRLSLLSDVVAAELDLDAVPFTLELKIDDHNPRACFIDHYLRIVFNAVLRRVERVRLHAAAVDFAGSTSLFVGDKGAGKTTICLHLAQAGGTVLAEDQLMVRRSADGGYRVAGGDTLMRLTAGTEGHFFKDPLPEPAILLAGVKKKEIRGRDYITYEPNRECTPQRIFFPEVQSSFAVRPLSQGQALSRLAAPLTLINRFTDDADRRRFLDFLFGLAHQVESFSLSLTNDLSDLEKLSRFLK